MEMRFGRALTVCLLGGIGLVGSIVACTTDYQKGLDDPLYGPPNALEGKKSPGGTIDFLASGEGGSTAVPGGTATKIACVANGGTQLDGGACTVSFKTEVLAILGTNNCAASSDCHGGAAPKYKPRIEPSDGPLTWAEFAAFQVGATPYINPCSTDKAQGSLLCNLQATGTCGTKMPYLAGQVSDADLKKIETWLACGSPNN